MLSEDGRRALAVEGYHLETDQMRYTCARCGESITVEAVQSFVGDILGMHARNHLREKAHGTQSLL